MNIRDEILKEHSRAQALKIAGYACASQKNFKELMKCFMSDEYRLAQRAAYSVSWAAIQKPEMITPYIKDLVSQMQRTDIHEAIPRNSLRILAQINIPDKFHGEVMNACFGFIENPSTPIAIKASSLTTLFNLSHQYPEIRQELKLVIEENWDHETAAFRSRGKKILKAFGKG
jgi:hypothetical protein